MKRFVFALLAVAIAGTAFAGEFRVPGMRSNDRYYTAFGLKQKIVGRIVTYVNGQRFHYLRDGSFIFQTRADATERTGRYKVRDNGMVCAYFDTGKVRCDTYVKSTKYTYFLTGGGQRWQVKSMVRE